MNHYKIEQRTHEDRTEFSVVDEINGEELARMKVVFSAFLPPYAVPDTGEKESRAIMDPSLVEALGEMFRQSAALLRKELSGG